MQLVILLTIGWALGIASSNDCLPRKFDEDSIVCVCNATYCDSVEIEVPERGKFRSYTSSLAGQRLESKESNFNNSINNGVALWLDLTKKYQKIHGFGGAFTDSAGLNIKSLTEPTQQQLMQTYFGRDGNRYNLGRVPVGGADFSTRPYTLDDMPGDIKLSNFSLAPEDELYKIPYMKRALELNPELRFVAASWTAPPWMKKNGRYSGPFGGLKTEYYQTYAEYLVKFLETYKDEGLPMWAMSTGNEPIDGFFPFIGINDMAWTPGSQAIWLANNLGPTIRESASNFTKILALDDQRYTLPWWIDEMYKTADVDKYIDGIAVHWYGDSFTPTMLLDSTHRKYPDKFIINSEACIVPLPWDPRPVRLGNWHRAEKYISDIIEDMNHWVTGWVDWNLALDKKGGPNWARNPVDSPVIVNPETDEFFKQPTYYALAHFSKFVPPGSTRVSLTAHRTIKSVAFITPDDEVIIVLHNPKRKKQTVSVIDPDQGEINIQLPPNSMQTVIYKR